ncbi:aspartate aminotransferase family protein [Cerasicoccus arenae]|uniref:Aspartate aminotransferase family protein n=1 Tax=Cerasicoccus arenae TaxID=424488 RepID=A0A8J3DJM4_9BACT|nr:aspartate aminotransferase family protein [Cerasicoccus arenae]MBK1857928.1 aspartate aminotransferase family protein [Cerasicoccus arenae]GHC00699.1 aspartate aminotransferase family protein [Cerasicoccus arenae]
MSEFDITRLITERAAENYDLHDQHVNSTLVKVLRTIGFDKVYASAKGSYLYDAEGQDYLDFLSGYGVFNIGRNHPLLAKTIKDVLDLDMSNMVQMDCALLSGLLAEKLVEITPPHLDAVFFCNSGAEAVEGALKFALGATGRNRILSLSGAYHGLTLGALSVTNNGNFQEGFGKLLPGVEQVIYGDLNDLEDKLRQGDVAAFIAEPVQGKGVYFPADDYFPQAQALCRRYGALFIMDEVQTGLGRTGKMWALEHWNLEPDILTVAKALSGGYVPAAAFLTRRDIHQRVFSRLDRCVVHSTTFGRNNLAMACGLATIHVLQHEKLVENAAWAGQIIEQKLLELKANHELIKDVRVKGCMVAIEFGEPRSMKMKLAWKGIHAVDKGLFPQMIVTPMMNKHRVLTHVAGHNLDIVKALPPLVIGETEIHRFISSLDDVLQDCTRLPGPMWDFGRNLVQTAIKQRKGKKLAPA